MGKVVDKVTASVTKFDAEVTVDVDIFGETIEELISNLSTRGNMTEDKAAEIVFSNAVSNMVITLQNALRRWAVEGKGEDAKLAPIEAVQAKVDSWVPGVVQRSGKSKLEKLEVDFDKLDEAGQAKFLEYLKARAKGQK